MKFPQSWSLTLYLIFFLPFVLPTTWTLAVHESALFLSALNMMVPQTRSFSLSKGLRKKRNSWPRFYEVSVFRPAVVDSWPNRF